MKPIRFSDFELWFWPAWFPFVEQSAGNCKSVDDLAERFWLQIPPQHRTRSSRLLVYEAAERAVWLPLKGSSA
jgi:hypothetical protein